MKTPISLWLILFSFLFAHAQDSSLKGRVTSGHNHQGLHGVNVVLKGSGHGTITSLHGEYELGEIPAGEQNLIFSFMGYETREVVLRIKEGQVLEFDLELKEGSIGLSAGTIEAQRPVSAASSKAIRDFDLKIKPAQSAQNLLQLVPGLVIAQHAGGGKAEQIFMRGFDADHGTDVGIYVDGMPVNMVTHGHGSGYTGATLLNPKLNLVFSSSQGGLTSFIPQVSRVRCYTVI